MVLVALTLIEITVAAMYFFNRMKPDFIIIGGVKCASSSLYRYLVDHPQILPCRVKEPGFFSDKSLFSIYLNWFFYSRLFPGISSTKPVESLWYELNEEGVIEANTWTKPRSPHTHYLTGEASAKYNFAANPEIVKTFLPDVKIMMVVRNPTKRFISHYKMFQRFEREGRVGYETGALVPFIEKEIADFKIGRYTRIIHQGIYYRYLPGWRNTFGNHFVLFQSEQLQQAETRMTVLNKATNMLGLPSCDFSDVSGQQFNVSKSDSVDYSEAIQLLDEFYRPFNEEFYNDFGINYNS